MTYSSMSELDGNQNKGACAVLLAIVEKLQWRELLPF